MNNPRGNDRKEQIAAGIFSNPRKAFLYSFKTRDHQK